MTSVPLMLVSSRSSTTTSGLCCSTSLTTSVPSVVQAATLMSGSPSSSARRPSITIAWSSASSTRIMVLASFRRQLDGQRRSPAGGALECERAAQHLHAILNAAQPEVPSLHAHVLLAREHTPRLEAAAVVRDGQRDRQTPPLDAHPLPGGARVPVAVRERLLLDGESLDDLAQLASLEPGGAEGADEIADLAKRALEQLHRLQGALRGGRVPREGALEHLELRQGGEDVLHRPVVHVEHDALQLALTGCEEAPRGGARLGVPNLGHPRPGGSARWIRSATNPSAAPSASAMATRTPPSTVAARRPMATPAPANAPAV